MRVYRGVKLISTVFYEQIIEVDLDLKESYNELIILVQMRYR